MDMQDKYHILYSQIDEYFNFSSGTSIIEGAAGTQQMACCGLQLRCKCRSCDVKVAAVMQQRTCDVCKDLKLNAAILAWFLPVELTNTYLYSMYTS